MKRYAFCVIASLTLAGCLGADPSDRYYWLAQQNIANQQFIANQAILQSQIDANERRMAAPSTEQWQPLIRTR